MNTLRLIAFGIFSLIGMASWAQMEIKPDAKWRLYSAGVHANHAHQTNHNQDYRQILGMMKNPKEADHDMGLYRESFREPAYGLSTGLSLRLIRDRNPRQSDILEFQLSYIDFAEIYSEYSMVSDPSQYIGWCLFYRSLELDVMYLRSWNKGWGGFRFGPSLGLTKTFDDGVMVLGKGEDGKVYEAQSNLFLSAHLNGQAYVNLGRRFEFNVQARAGVGTQLRQTDFRTSLGLGAGLSYKFGIQKQDKLILY